MANFFDQFDQNAQAAPAAEPVASGNFFDQFDKSPSFVDKSSADWDKRAANVRQITADAEKNNQNPLRTAAQTAGQGFGVINDAVGNALGSAYQTVTPQPVQDAISAGGKAIAESVPGQLVGEGLQKVGQKYDDLVPEGTPLRHDLDAAGNLIGAESIVIPIGNAPKGLIKSGEALSSAGGKLAKAGDIALDAKRSDFLQDLITPKETPTVKNDLFSRSKEEGILNTRVVQPTAQEEAIKSSLHDLDISPMKSLNENYNIIGAAKDAEAKSLMEALRANDVAIPDASIVQNMHTVLQDLSKNPWVATQDGTAAATKVMSGAMEALEKNPRTASGLLQARKDFDNWISSQRGGNIFDPNLESPITAAVRQIRQTINNMVADAVPDANVKASLARQSNFYRAMDSIETKGGSEGKNIIDRGIKKLDEMTPGEGVVGKTLGSVITAGKLLKGAVSAGSPYAKKGVGTVAERVGEALQAIGKGSKNIAAQNPSPPEQLLLENNHADTVMRNYAERNRKLEPTNPTVYAGAPKAPPEQLRLPAPDKELVATPNGAPRPMTAAEETASKTGRARASELGLSPDVARVINKNMMRSKVGAAWDKFDDETKDQIGRQIEQAWRENPKTPIADLIEQAQSAIEQFHLEIGEKIPNTAIGEALTRAKTLQEVSKMPAKEGNEFLKVTVHPRKK